MDALPPADVADATAQAVTDRAKHLGLTWGIRLATIDTAADPSNITGIYDGDTASIGLIPMEGLPAVGDRVYVLAVDSGNFIVGSTNGPFRARKTLAGTSPSVTFMIPSAMRSVRILWTARSDRAANDYDVIGVYINSDSVGPYAWDLIQNNNGVLTAGTTVPATYLFGGYFPGPNTTAGIFGSGTIDIVGWDSPHPGYLGITCDGQAWANNNHLLFNSGGYYSPVGPYTSVTLFSQSLANFVAGSDFQVYGEPA